MIKTKACSYPHPVLGLTSDMDGQFDLQCEIEQNQEERTLIFHFDFEVTNEYVSELIKSRKCACVVLVTCSSTMMAWSVLDLSVPFSISEDDISGKLEIEPSIIALQCLTDYSDVSFNSISRACLSGLTLLTWLVLPESLAFPFQRIMRKWVSEVFFGLLELIIIK